jgi:pyruvate,water dikinase
MVMRDLDLIRPLDALGGGDRLTAGGKAASLGELCRAGLPVPPGFVVTAAAFRHALAVVDPDGALGSADRRARLLAAPLAADLAAAVSAAYSGLGADSAVAVRSSATQEDSADASFAGLQDTYLWVRGTDSVLAHVRRCWASLYNPEAVSYRQRQRHQVGRQVAGQPEDDAAMGVVVQRMVEPRAAGVMFTCSPVTGDRSVIAIEGTWGLGSVLVGGEVTPDSFAISKVTGEILRRQVALKLRLHELSPAGSGIVAGDVPQDLRERPCLTDGQIRALAEVAKRVEAHYGVPQDIEWALVASGGGGDDIVLLQSRPETVWTTRAAAPVAVPKPRAMDHVFEQLGHGFTQ